jgi:23S rRNA (cytidine1920-2'-O)/16S rRNA (cytidine1409-2'-O)-methyltransferase
MKARQLRLDEILLNSGFFIDIKAAQAFIISQKVVVDGIVCSKPGTAIKKNSEVFIREIPLKFASKGGFKLEKALDSFNIDVMDKVILDAGASTGGFTDCLLQRGAQKVYAVDAGYGQFSGRLANDPRVSNLEKMNIGNLKIEMFEPPIDFCTIDLSYLSLTKAIAIIKPLFKKPLEIVCLIKPLYEGLNRELMNDPDELEKTLNFLFEKLIEEQHVIISDCIVSPILGGRGATEFIAHIQENSMHISHTPDELIKKAIMMLKTSIPKDLTKNEIIKIYPEELKI